MFHQLWEDSVNIKQRLACQTSFQKGTCHPLAPGSRAAARPSVCSCSWETPMAAARVRLEVGRAELKSHTCLCPQLGMAQARIQ